MAADPDRSTWLTANAGSGKTRVLTDRVARLLLDGTRPERVLCLTYTKAAATEMQNRLLKRLGEWAMLDDAALTERIAKRFAEQGRPDDNPESFKVRLEAYNRNTAPLLPYYEAQGKLTEADGMGSIESVAKAIDEALA